MSETILVIYHIKCQDCERKYFGLSKRRPLKIKIEDFKKIYYVFVFFYFNTKSIFLDFFNNLFLLLFRDFDLFNGFYVLMPC